jgi:hypothetical protein
MDKEQGMTLAIVAGATILCLFLFVGRHYVILGAEVVAATTYFYFKLSK